MTERFTKSNETYIKWLEKAMEAVEMTSYTVADVETKINKGLESINKFLEALTDSLCDILEADALDTDEPVEYDTDPDIDKHLGGLADGLAFKGVRHAATWIPKFSPGDVVGIRHHSGEWASEFYILTRPDEKKNYWYWKRITGGKECGPYPFEDESTGMWEKK